VRPAIIAESFAAFKASKVVGILRSRQMATYGKGVTAEVPEQKEGLTRIVFCVPVFLLRFSATS
jgi:hypothetical protein